MNRTRRKCLANLSELLEELRISVETLRDEEQEYMDAMPENLQGSTRYEVAEAAVSNLDDAMDSISDAISSIEEAMA